MPTDKEMMDFLESLRDRKRRFGKYSKNESWQSTDIHISGFSVSLYARAGIGSDIEFSGGGETVRECIAKAMENSKV
jgi:hypothetical protein